MKKGRRFPRVLVRKGDVDSELVADSGHVC